MSLTHDTDLRFTFRTRRTVFGFHTDEVKVQQHKSNDDLEMRQSGSGNRSSAEAADHQQAPCLLSAPFKAQFAADVTQGVEGTCSFRHRTPHVLATSSDSRAAHLGKLRPHLPAAMLLSAKTWNRHEVLCPVTVSTQSGANNQKQQRVESSLQSNELVYKQTTFNCNSHYCTTTTCCLSAG